VKLLIEAIMLCSCSPANAILHIADNGIVLPDEAESPQLHLPVTVLSRRQHNGCTVAVVLGCRRPHWA